MPRDDTQNEGGAAPAAPDLKELLPVCCNSNDDVLFGNIQSCVDRQLPLISSVDGHDRIAVVVGGGPSLADTMEDIRALQDNGAVVYALNGAGLYLQSHGIIPHALIILDARDHNHKFLKGLDLSVTLYLASQCDPGVFDAAIDAGFSIVCWHPPMDGKSGVTETRPTVLIDGGTTVGIRSLHMMWVLGYRTLHLFGYDSSYRDKADHAYVQPENESDRRIPCDIGGIQFLSSPWMIRQVDDFQNLAPQFMKCGMNFHVHGSGLLPRTAEVMFNPPDLQELHAIYDLTTHPASWDFFSWLTICKMEAWRREIPVVRVSFASGPNGGYRNDGLPVDLEYRQTIFDNVMKPAVKLLGCEGGGFVSEAVSGYTFPYMIFDIVELYKSGVPLPVYKAPKWATEKVHKILGERRPVIIVLREAEHWLQRNSRIEDWIEFARTCGEDVLFLRDSHKAYESFHEFDTLPEASLDINVRLALYERAKVVMSTSNGPMCLPIFSEIPYLDFKLLVPDYNPGKPEWIEHCVGVKPGEQFPWVKPWQRLVWEDDSLPALRRAFDSIREALENRDGSST